MTQIELAASSGVSRATIAQLEGGDGDPRLSTLLELAVALGISPMMLLMGEVEMEALARLAEQKHQELLEQEQLDEMRRLLASGLRKHRREAVTIGADAAAAAGLSAVGAAIGSFLVPGRGTVIGAALGAALGGLAGTMLGDDPDRRR